jgi:hypothetical protein
VRHTGTAQTLGKLEKVMSRILKAIAVIAGCALFSASAFAQSAKEIRDASPYNAIDNETAPKLIVDPPLPDRLALGVLQVQYRAENVHIVPVFGAGGLKVSPRIGHLHITVDDLPWHWADASDSNTVDVVGLPPGEHKVLIELVDPQHQVFTGCPTCRQTVTFTVPQTEPHRH